MSRRVDRARALPCRCEPCTSSAVAALKTTSLRLRMMSVTSSTTSRNRRELVERAVDAQRRDRRALQRREEHAPERVAERDAEAALEGLAGELPVELRRAVRLDGDALRTDEIAPISTGHRHRHAGVLHGDSGSRDRPDVPGEPAPPDSSAVCPRAPFLASSDYECSYRSRNSKMPSRFDDRPGNSKRNSFTASSTRPRTAREWPARSARREPGPSSSCP